MNNNNISEGFLKELEAEAPATRKCLERIPGNLFEYKPHERSMAFGYLALIVAEVPRWITEMIETSMIDFAVFKHIEAKSAEDLVKQFDENMAAARKAFVTLTDAELSRPFSLKVGEKVLSTEPLGESIGSTLNHWVHHRGQLTVYMRLNDIPVPSIYGPSADDQGAFAI